jgi:hypothetical protein
MVSRTTKLFIALAGAALTLASGGCGSEDPTTGSISVVVTGAGAGLGLTGNLIVEVRYADFVPVATDNSLYAKTLEEGVPLIVPTFDGLPPRDYLVDAFLDRNGNLYADTGDVWPGAVSYPATVRAGADSLVVVTLTYVP